MATIRDVAKRANVGVGTVSRALNGTGYVAADKREAIFAAASELEYEIPRKKAPTLCEILWYPACYTAIKIPPKQGAGDRK